MHFQGPVTELDREVQVGDVLEALAKLPPERPVQILGAGPVRCVLEVIPPDDDEPFIVLSSAASMEEIQDLQEILMLVDRELDRQADEANGEEEGGCPDCWPQVGTE